MKLLVGLLFAVVISGASSCSKCTVCTKNNEPDVRLCEKDYDSHTAYGLAIDVYEAQNYDCKKAP